MKEKILSDFITNKKILDSFCERTVNLLTDLLQQKKILFHHISGRTKDYESLSKKIDRKLNKYTSLHEITDIVGVRIISYLESDVDVIASLILQEFTVDPKNSIDKRELNTDQFGYKSLHLVVNINASRATLTEYKDYKNLKFEIQIRSILQHAWAEIEHDLGYKGKSAIPDQYKRNFNRLAALLETADLEFDRLKGELSNYEIEVGKLIKKSPQDVKINQASLANFNNESNILQEARKLMSTITGWTYEEHNNDLNGILERFDFFEIKTIKDLDDSLKNDKKIFFKFLEEFVKNLKFPTITKAIALYYYQHFLAGKTENIKKVSAYQNYQGASIAGEPQTYIDNYLKAKNQA